MQSSDVLVVGKGNAALCAALALYAAGEMIGGLFYFNYPSGPGLVSGAVFGRLAGTNAAAAATGRQ